MIEDVDRRVLAAFRCVGAASDANIRDGIDLFAPMLKIRRTASGYYVVFDAPGMRSLTTRLPHVRSGYETRGSTRGDAVAGRDDETGVRRSG